MGSSGASSGGPPPLTTQSGTSYTLAAADANSVIDLTNSSAVTVTVPPSSSVAWATNTIINLCCQGAGGVTIAQGSGVTVNNNANALTQWEEASLRYDGNNVWVRAG